MPLRTLKAIFLNRYLLFLAILYLYLWLTDPLIELTKGILNLEVPLLLYIYFCLNAWMKRSRWQALVAGVPIAAAYLLHDYYFVRFYRIIKLAEVTQLPELAGVVGMGPLLLALGLAGAFLYLMAAFFSFSLKAAGLSLPALGLLLLPFVHPKAYIDFFTWRSIEVIYYAAVINVEYNGRLATALYHEAKRRETLNNIAQYRDINQLSLRLPPEMEKQATGRNVHLIVLESFVDPALFTRLPKGVQAAYPDYSKRVAPAEGLSISPVFGGYTSQAEFEILCGVPAFQEFDDIEFNIFTGSESYCLPNILKGFGYKTLASNGFKPDFFNTIPAYKSIGFDAAHFSIEYAPGTETYLSKGDDKENKYFFDGDMYEQNLAFVKKQLEEKKPFLNYLLTVYGHFPFDLGRRTGPPVLTVPGVSSAVEKVLNQHYYRSKALVSYLDQLMALDPQALIVLVSDHLPPLPGGTDEYKSLGYLLDHPDQLHANRLMVFRDGQPEKHARFAHFNIYSLILDYVTGGAYCRSKTCDYSDPTRKDHLRGDYRIIMGLASR